MPVDSQIFGRAEDIWWSGGEPFAMLRTMLNLVRFEYFRNMMSGQMRGDPRGSRALDVGCGGGLLVEEFARLGMAITGIDPSRRSIATAARHAAENGLEHVGQPARMIGESTRCLEA